MEPEFMSDAFDDLAADRAERQFTPPRVYDAPRDFVPNWIAARELLAADGEFLKVVDPVAFLIRGTMQARAEYLGMVHVATQVQARGMRHSAYSLGLVEPPRRLTRADKVAAESRAWGLS